MRRVVVREILVGAFDYDNQQMVKIEPGTYNLTDSQGQHNSSGVKPLLVIEGTKIGFTLRMWDVWTDLGRVEFVDRAERAA